MEKTSHQNKKNKYVISKKGIQRVYNSDLFPNGSYSYKDDLLYFYNMTEEEANKYWKELKYNESLILRKDV